MRTPALLLPCALLLAGCPSRTGVVQAGPDAASRTTEANLLVLPSVTTEAAPAPPAPAPPVNVRLSLRTSPATHARVTWGKKLLGETPLAIERPKDSGPLDLVVRAGGFLPVHTRLYTHKNDSLTVELTRPADKTKILGAKIELPPEEEMTAPSLDGGVTAQATAK